MNGTDIKVRRLELGWTQLDLANVAGVSPATVYRIESGADGSRATRNLLMMALTPGNPIASARKEILKRTGGV